MNSAKSIDPSNTFASASLYPQHQTRQMTRHSNNQTANQTANKTIGHTTKQTRLDLHAPHSHNRKIIENYIAQQYQQTYDAQITEFSPLLLGLCTINLNKTALNKTDLNENQIPETALGLKPGFMGKLFLEHYLDAPIEQVIAQHSKQPVDRHHVVEIANLVSTRRGGSLPLFLMMATALNLAGYRWMTFTATPQVEKLVKRLGVNLQTLAPAEAGKLQTATDKTKTDTKWGRYYDSNPYVLFGNLNEAVSKAQSKPQIQKFLQQHQHAIHSLAQRLRDHRRLCQTSLPIVKKGV